MAKKHSWLRSQIAHFPDFPVQNMIVAQAWGLNMQNTYLQETKIHGHVWGLWHLRGALKACTLASYRWEWVGCNVSASPPSLLPHTVHEHFASPVLCSIAQYYISLYLVGQLTKCSVQCTVYIVHRTSCRLEQGIEVFADFCKGHLVQMECIDLQSMMWKLRLR